MMEHPDTLCHTLNIFTRGPLAKNMDKQAENYVGGFWVVFFIRTNS